MFMTGAYAQTHTVSGLVKDKEMGEPLVGVSVSVKGTKNATMTDLNGNYTIQTNAKDVLEFKYVGMKMQRKRLATAKLSTFLFLLTQRALAKLLLQPWVSSVSRRHLPTRHRP